MAIGLRRKVRLDSRRERQAITRRKNSNDKRPERARRDQRLAAKLKGQLDQSIELSADVSSWAAGKLGCPAAKASPDALRALCA
ncbi:MAG: hypothetical protein EA401_09980 [Planctomycetota bacterium]|nr:MAG: hypothetical protein EA401_09980 [Planctomycetota bacterium]